MTHPLHEWQPFARSCSHASWLEPVGCCEQGARPTAPRAGRVCFPARPLVRSSPGWPCHVTSLPSSRAARRVSARTASSGCPPTSTGGGARRTATSDFLRERGLTAACEPATQPTPSCAIRSASRIATRVMRLRPRRRRPGRLVRVAGPPGHGRPRPLGLCAGQRAGGGASVPGDRQPPDRSGTGPARCGAGAVPARRDSTSWPDVAADPPGRPIGPQLIASNRVGAMASGTTRLERRTMLVQARDRVYSDFLMRSRRAVSGSSKRPWAPATRSSPSRSCGGESPGQGWIRIAGTSCCATTWTPTLVRPR